MISAMNEWSTTDRPIRRLTMLVGLVVTACALVFALAQAAYAHDKLVGSNPVAGTTVDKLPSVVTLYFEEPPVSGYTSMDIVGPSGHVLSESAPTTQGSNVSVHIYTASARGSYAIRYHILSDDGHPVSGTIPFVVAAASSVASATNGAATTSTPATSDSLGIIAALSVVALVGAAAVSLLLRRRRSARVA